MPRPAADVVVPFAGSREALAALVARLSQTLVLGPDDRLVVVDNRPPPGGAAGADDRVLPAPGLRSSYHARNVGSASGTAPWIVFLDADVEPAPDLLDRYLEPSPPAGAAVLVGGIEEQPAPPDAPVALRYAALVRSMSQDRTLEERGRWGFAQTANCAVRREAFEAVGGFCATVRSGGDADLCYRLVDAGWALHPVPAACVTHRNRATLPRLLSQRVRHGSGAAWLQRRHPGSSPARRPLGLLWWSAKRVAGGLRGDRDARIVGLVDPLAVWAVELGRLIPNRARRARG